MNNKFLGTLHEKGYLFARGGGERPYQPTRDCPFDVPSFTIRDASLARQESFAAAAKQSTGGRIVVDPPATTDGAPHGGEPQGGEPQGGAESAEARA